MGRISRKDGIAGQQPLKGAKGEVSPSEPDFNVGTGLNAGTALAPRRQ